MTNKKAPFWKYGAVIAISAAMCVALNNLIIISNLASISDGYEETSTALYSAPLEMQLLCLVVLIPICEELVFRGLMFKRMRERSGFLYAAVYSALVFGLFHGNIVQMVYGFILGMLLAYMYEKYGYYKDDVKAITLKGIEGLEKIQTILETLRADAPKEIGGYKVLKVRDYKKDTITDLADGKVTSTGLPASNVLYYELEDDAWVCVRPSGTEPKVKFYYGIKGTSLEEADAKSESLGKEVLAMIEKML